MAEASGGERAWVWYGGQPSVDFVNTRRRRHAEPVEYLTEPADLAAWFAAADLAPARSGRARRAAGPDDALFARALDLREAVDSGIRAAVDGTAIPDTALDTLNAWLADTPSPRLHRDGPDVVLRGPADTDPALHALHALAADAAQLLGSPDRARLRVCPGPNCGGRFVDRSPSGRRRWCSMAVCGNRAKAAKHRETARD
ncbi:CGNR zinc finger domain-containing protein [Yinghuangia seranimata]|uniref:CGNR zinc finger domain-containing protein n=1 Tax=Yinghuangia seranimata TaxID=408067 RepID=UPI00248D0EC0|nr:ABATE domain-containing protein [Yinghuangia seranimata]MDI2129607.1 ABATE domain-containing protein [Yinghuangia seranimata]